MHRFKTNEQIKNCNVSALCTRESCARSLSYFSYMGKPKLLWIIVQYISQLVVYRVQVLCIEATG
jgi:hypothetical protein